MKIYIGDEGLTATYQEAFPKTVKCHKCKKLAKVMFVGIEDIEKKYICNLHKTTGRKGGLWLHDSMSCAVYLCPNCFEGTVLINQA